MKLWVSTRPIFYFITLLLSILSFYSCEQAGGIGEELGNNINSGVFFADTFTVKTSTVLVENETSGTSRLLVGNYIDPVFGKVYAQSYFEALPDSLLLVNNSDDFPLIYDSLRITLPINYTYVDTTTEVKVNLHRIIQDGGIDEDTDYTNASSLEFDPNPIGTHQFKVSTADAEGQISFLISNEVGLEIFENANNNITVEEFRDSFKGFAILPDTNFNPDAAMVGFKVLQDNLLDGNIARVFLHYTERQLRDGESDTLINRLLPLLPTRGQRFNQIINDRSGTALSDLVNVNDEIPSSQSQDLLYAQAGTGVLTKIEFPTFQNLINLGNVAINRAELVLRVSPGSTTELAPPFSLIFAELETGNQIRRDDNNNPIFLQYVDPRTRTLVPISFDFNSRFEEYRAGNTSEFFTNYLNNFISGNTDTQSLLVTPSGNISTANRVILNNSSRSGFQIQLRVFYTVFN